MEQPKIYAALAAIMSEVDAIGKSKKNAQQGFSYRGIDDVYNAVHSLFARHGVVCIPRVLERVREERTTSKGNAITHTIARVAYTFYASDGSSVEAVVDGEGMDSADKSTSKALAIAHKYCLFQLLLIPTEDIVDPDGESHGTVRPRGVLPERGAQAEQPSVITEAQVSQLMDLIDQSRDQELLDKVLKMAGAASLSSLRSTLFDKVLRKLQATLEAEAKVAA
jgi:hypothetical protein